MRFQPIYMFIAFLVFASVYMTLDHKSAVLVKENNKIKKERDELKEKVRVSEFLIDRKIQEMKSKDSILLHYFVGLEVTASVYHAVENQTDSDPRTTASTYYIQDPERALDERIIAVSEDLLDVFPFGTKLAFERNTGLRVRDEEWTIYKAQRVVSFEWRRQGISKIEAKELIDRLGMGGDRQA